MSDELILDDQPSTFEDENLAKLIIMTIALGLFLLTLIRFPKMTIFKLRLLAQAFSFRFLGKDMAWTQPPDVAAFIQAAQNRKEPIQQKRLIFIRHGESTWNDTFNRSLNPIKFIPRLIYALMTELSLFMAGQCDSWFYDSPLSQEGADQANELAEKLQHADRTDSDMQALLGLTPNSIVVSSPLRRCLSTAALGLSASLQPLGPRCITVLPSLQEISCNPDTLAITPPRAQPLPSWLDAGFSQHVPAVYSRCDVSQYDATKPLKGRGIARLQAFAAWVFEKCPAHVSTVVVSGHSFWCRFFFRAYLPAHTTAQLAADAKTLKICNAGAVAFDFCRDAAGNCWVNEHSLKVLNGKFVP